MNIDSAIGKLSYPAFKFGGFSCCHRNTTYFLAQVLQMDSSQK